VWRAAEAADRERGDGDASRGDEGEPLDTKNEHPNVYIRAGSVTQLHHLLVIAKP
jgi:hypothetical protein